MIAANTIARQRGLLEAKLEEEIADKLLLPSLLMKPQLDALEANAIINAMKKDKKRVGDNLALIMMDSNFVLSRVNDLTGEEVSAALGETKTRLGY